MPKLVSVRFYDESGEGKTGLSPVVTIRDQSDNSVIVDGVSMTEDSDAVYFAGRYFYSFEEYSADTDYKYEFDAGTATGVAQQYKGYTNPDSSLFEDLSAKIDRIPRGGGGVSMTKNVERVMTDDQADRIAERVLKKAMDKDFDLDINFDEAMKPLIKVVQDLVKVVVKIEATVDLLKDLISQSLGVFQKMETKIVNSFGKFVQTAKSSIEEVSRSVCEKTKPHEMDTTEVSQKIVKEVIPEIKKHFVSFIQAVDLLIKKAVPKAIDGKIGEKLSLQLNVTKK